ncbi:MAG: hypothetical protein K2N48_02585 [Muribaculaceae bacterium]|nr:hypothetical protein [Muribaculaceae bacterium]
MNKTATSLISLSLLPLSSLAWDAPTMGWSSWNAFGHHINEAIIRSQADVLVEKGLKDAGYTFVNIDDGAWCGRDAAGHLNIHPTRFPNGLKPLIDHIHAAGLKAGTYSDAGHNTCASFWGGDRDGIGTGLYEHDEEDARFMFGELGFDFIKVDFCGGDGPQNSEMLDLDERERYTAISEAIKATGRTDVRYNVCRWAYPGTWVEDVASSWRMSQDIYLGWESVKDIIHQNLYLSAYATRGRFNDMDMLEVGRGMSEEEDRTHFGMWCMMSSPLLIGCDLREIDNKAIALLTNPELISLNQDPLALQATVVKRENDSYVLVKDIDELHGTSRAVALYNPTDKALLMGIDFFDIDLGEEAEVRDLFERKDLGHFSDYFETIVPPHGTRIYRITADRRLERRVYEAETAFNPSYQELDNNQAVKSGIYEELDICSGGAKASWLGAREDNYVVWSNVWSNEGGEYEIGIRFITGADRRITVKVNGVAVETLAVNSGAWDRPGEVIIKVNLNKGTNEISLSNPDDWMPDIDCITLTRKGDLELYRHRHKQVLRNTTSIDKSSLPDKMAARFDELIILQSDPFESKDSYEKAIEALKDIALEIEYALEAQQSFGKTLDYAVRNSAASEASEALSRFDYLIDEAVAIVAEAELPEAYSEAISLLESSTKEYLSDEGAMLTEGKVWDMTCFIENPDFNADSHGWKGEPVWGSHVAEYWNRTFDASQTIEGLRNGFYTLNVQALYRVNANDGGSAYRSGTEMIPARIYANESSMPVSSLYSHPLSESPRLEEELTGTHVLRGYVNSMHGAEMAFNYGLYWNILPTTVNDGKLLIGIASDRSQNDSWCCFDNFTLYFQGADNNSVEIKKDSGNDIVDVYTPDGICVACSISRSEISLLPAGIYIAGGEKIIVK